MNLELLADITDEDEVGFEGRAEGLTDDADAPASVTAICVPSPRKMETCFQLPI